jgi:phosphatidylglycerophosphate synthase
MSADPGSLAQHPAPHRDRVSRFASAFGLWGAPCAWAVQLCTGLALSSYPCFPNERRYSLPIAGLAWTGTAAVVVTLVAIAIALVALAVSIRSYGLTSGEVPGDHRRLLESGTGRARLLARWGVCTSAGFAVATAFNGVSYLLLPRCMG